jgi:hypothetical protein
MTMSLWSPSSTALSSKVLDAIRDFYGRPEVNEGLRGGLERGLIAEHADGSVTLTIQARSSFELPSTSITVGCPPARLPARKPS